MRRCAPSRWHLCSCSVGGCSPLAAVTQVRQLNDSRCLNLPLVAEVRVYAAYGGVYIGVALVWLLAIDRVQPKVTDWVGVAVCFIGMAIIMFGPRESATLLLMPARALTVCYQFRSRASADGPMRALAFMPWPPAYRSTWWCIAASTAPASLTSRGAHPPRRHFQHEWSRDQNER